MRRASLSGVARADWLCKGGYVLGFYSDPDDDSAQHESVSPENLFSQHRGDFDVLPTEEQLVSQSTPQS